MKETVEREKKGKRYVTAVRVRRRAGARVRTTADVRDSIVADVSKPVGFEKKGKTRESKKEKEQKEGREKESGTNELATRPNGYLGRLTGNPQVSFSLADLLFVFHCIVDTLLLEQLQGRETHMRAFTVRCVREKEERMEERRGRQERERRDRVYPSIVQLTAKETAVLCE